MQAIFTEDLDLILKERRLRWYGDVECSNGDFQPQIWSKTVFSIVKIWFLTISETAAYSKTPENPMMMMMMKQCDFPYICPGLRNVNQQKKNGLPPQE